MNSQKRLQKFDELISKNKVTRNTNNITNKKKSVINLYSRQSIHVETNLLAEGLNFSINSKTLPNKDIVATIEDAVKDLEKEEAEISLTLQTPTLLWITSSKARANFENIKSDTSIVIYQLTKIYCCP